jgi:Ca2+/Na+ antiporter
MIGFLLFLIIFILLCVTLGPLGFILGVGLVLLFTVYAVVSLIFSAVETSKEQICPYCRAQIPKEATVCKYCTRDISPNKS